MKDDRIYLGHIRDVIRDIEEYSAVGRERFMTDRMRQDAVIRKLEIIGEAVKQLSDATRPRRPEISWKQIAGMRDRLTHNYFGWISRWFGGSGSMTYARSAWPSTRCYRSVQVRARHSDRGCGSRGDEAARVRPRPVCETAELPVRTFLQTLPTSCRPVGSTLAFLS